VSNFLIYSNKLRQWVKSLSPEQSEDFINDAWRDIREANDQWSFLLAQEYWLAPGSISLTGVGVTQFSSTLILNNHNNLLLVAGLNNPPITNRQLRFGLSGGPIYEISGTNALKVTDGAITSGTSLLTSISGPFDATHVGRLIVVVGAGSGGSNLQTTIASFVSPTQVNLTINASTTVGPNATISWGSTITLARLYNEDTNANNTALLYRIYFSPQTTDFQRLDHLLDPITGYEFGWDIESIDELDRRDPQRSAVREPYRLFFHHFDIVTGLPVYELWPGPSVSRAYVVTFWRLGLPFTNDTDALPPQITEELLLTRARLLAYEWGEANDPDPKMRQSYSSLKQYIRNRYSTEAQPGRPLGLLDQAMRRDEEVSLVQGRKGPRQPGPGWPVDSNFAQSHAIPGWWSG
jgi:hypothetical protein